MLFAFVLLIVPGFIALAWTFAIPMAIVLEGYNVSEAFTRARGLARGSVLRILGVLTLMFLLFMLLMIAVGAILGFAAGALGAGPRVIAALGDVGLALVYPIFGVGGTLLYYDLRIRKEGFDLEIMAHELSGAAPASV